MIDIGPNLKDLLEGIVFALFLCAFLWIALRNL